MRFWSTSFQTTPLKHLREIIGFLRKHKKQTTLAGNLTSTRFIHDLYTSDMAYFPNLFDSAHSQLRCA